ncbi:ABC transporter permease [Actibacterium pelagium]|uniref:ABC transporter permease n=1 Tax=Actibacterium pelagium TaxID=2029103 RepID=UPI000BAAB848|nr:ABC transporter permease [Actibacterium pelagium]
MALSLREMSTTYGASPGGYLWAVLEPAAGITLLTMVFSLGFQAPSLGTNFPIFYATGMIPFLMFTEASGKTALSLLFSRPLLAYPRVTFLDAILARFFVATMTQLLVAYLLLTGIWLVFDTRTLPQLPVIALAFLLVACLSLGVGVMNAFLFTAVPLWQRAWSIATRPLFIISGVFFTFESVPQPYRDLLWFNPISHLIGLLRRGFYPGYDANFVSIPYVCGTSLGLLVLGLVFLRRHHRTMLDG